MVVLPLISITVISGLSILVSRIILSLSDRNYKQNLCWQIELIVPDQFESYLTRELSGFCYMLALPGFCGP